jgi:hypothetical protein
MVRDGLTNITKLEFLSCIGQVRQQAFKRSTILSAFKKTGIWPYDPETVLETLKSRLPKRTPTPPPIDPELHSSPFSTPLTLRQMNKVADKIESVIQEDQDLDPVFADNINRFIRGGLSLATELIQTKRDLGRTKLAEQVAKQRRAAKNSALQSGGVLTIEQGREMVRQRGEDELAKARRLVEAAEQRAYNQRKRCFEDAARKARMLRHIGRLPRAEVVDSEFGSRLLKRF